MKQNNYSKKRGKEIQTAQIIILAIMSLIAALFVGLVVY